MTKKNKENDTSTFPIKFECIVLCMYTGTYTHDFDLTLGVMHSNQLIDTKLNSYILYKIKFSMI